MLFQTVALLAMSASTMAHPHASRHRHHFKPSGSGNVVAPTGGVYGMGNSTSAYGPTGTGFVTGTSAVATEIAPESSVDTAIAAALDSSACAADSQSTTTIYSTDLVTMTVTSEDTTTVKISSASATGITPSYSMSNATVTRTGEFRTSSATVSLGATSTGESSIDAASTTTSEISSAATYESYAVPVSSGVISVTSDLPAETTESPSLSSEGSYVSSTMKEPGAFYQVSPDRSATALSASSIAAAASSSPAPVLAAISSTGSYGSSKRGLAYNSAALTNAFAGKSMGWAYNWAANPSGTLGSGIEYVPMLWGQKKFSEWDAAAKTALAAGAKHLLSFNEPDLGAQANMDSKTAAAAHIKYMNSYASQAKIGSPAVTNGGPKGGTDGMGLGWMENFFTACNGNCKVDFLTFHWYDSATNVAYFKNYVQSVIDMASKHGVQKVWLTEFGASGSDAEVAKFLAEVLPWMDGIDAVERYAYFFCADGHLVSGTSISDPVGMAYAA